MILFDQRWPKQNSAQHIRVRNPVKATGLLSVNAEVPTDSCTGNLGCHADVQLWLVRRRTE